MAILSSVPWGVTQTIISAPEDPIPGNCLQAAVASLFDLPLDEVPHFALFDQWHQALNLWLGGAYGLIAVRSDARKRPGRYLLVGQSPRHAEWTHVVVAQNGRIAWDPHPDRSGLVDQQWTLGLGAVDEVGKEWLAAAQWPDWLVPAKDGS